MGTSDTNTQSGNQDKSHKHQDSQVSNKNEKVKHLVMKGSEEVNKVLDRTYHRLRPLETLFLVSVVLCCTVLCLYVTYSHLQLRDQVKQLQEELSKDDFVSYKWRRKVEDTLQDHQDISRSTASRLNKGQIKN